jgi:hypothetical protein
MAFIPFQSSSAAIVLYVGTTLFAALIARTFQSWYRLRHIPGPFAASLSIWWLLSRTVAGRSDRDLQEACGKYGKQ